MCVDKWKHRDIPCRVQGRDSANIDDIDGFD